jgi:3-dehydroquinate synthase
LHVDFPYGIGLASRDAANIIRSTMPAVRVSLKDHAYDVHVDRGLVSRAGELLRPLTRSTKIGIVSDEAVAAHYLAPLKQSLEAAGFSPIVHIAPPGEPFKTLSTIAAMCDTFLAARWERTNPIIALGGGVIGDMTGYAAASILRGVPFIQMPTTLLSMVDASVGGKTGVNAAAGKNLIGAFHQPIAVLADIDTLATLSEREFVSGLAECIKHDIIRDADHFAWFETNVAHVRSRDPQTLVDLVAHNVAIKARVVEIDPLERGERAHLNFGHTFGHGIERASDYSLTHGESVGLGMVAASRTATSLGMIDATACERIVRLIAAAGLPTTGLNVPIDAILSAMASDKKVANAKLRFVLPDRLGHVVIRDDVPDQLVRDAVASLA